MKNKLYTIKDCNSATSTQEKIVDIILKKLYKIKADTLLNPVYCILDKKSYIQLNKECGEWYMYGYLGQVFGLEIKVVKSKEQIIFVGI